MLQFTLLSRIHSLILTLPNIPSRSLPRSSSRTPPGLVLPGPHKVTKLVTTNKPPMPSVLTTVTTQPQSLRIRSQLQSIRLLSSTMALLTTLQATLAPPGVHPPTNHPPGKLQMAGQVAQHGPAPSSALDNQALPSSSNLQALPSTSNLQALPSTINLQALPSTINRPMASTLLSIQMCRNTPITTAPWPDLQALSLRLMDLVLANPMLLASLSANHS